MRIGRLTNKPIGIIFVLLMLNISFLLPAQIVRAQAEYNFVSVSSDPSGAFFTLGMNGKYVYGGATPWSQNYLPSPANYSVLWASMPGYTAPSPETKYLDTGGSISFYGKYLDVPETNIITIESSPSGASFTLIGPTTYTGTTPYKKNNALAGSYTITWNPIAGYATPSPDTISLSEGSTCSYAVNYAPEADTGYINVTSNLSSASFSLIGPINHSGVAPWSSRVPVGSYTINWNQISGYAGPPSETNVVAKDCTTSFFGNYQQSAPQTGSISVNSNVSNASFNLRGPENYSNKTPWNVGYAPAGNYTITWYSIGGYTTPSSETKNLPQGSSISFYGNYQQSAQSTLPDLIVEDIQVTPDPPVAGSSATTIAIRVKNQGSSNASGAFFLDLYFDGTYQGRVTVNGLTAGSTNTSTWNAMKWPSDNAPHTIRGVVDSGNAISESSEGNNELSKQFTASGPANEPPTLSNGYVTPSSGDTSKTFDYYITYTDTNNDAPGSYKYVYIDGAAHMMTQTSGNYSSGAVFKYSTTLSAGNHDFYFYFNDGYGHLVRLPASGTYSGPTISSSSLPSAVVSATIISYSPSSKIEVDPGQSFTLGVNFTNTGNAAWDFLAGVSVWDANGNLVINEWSSTIRVQAGQQGSYSWTKSISTTGEYNVQFGVWKDRSTLLDKGPRPWQNLIMVTASKTIQRPPNQPTSISQFKSDGATSIGVGEITNESTVVIKGVVSDPDDDQVKLQVELRRLDEYGGSFTGDSTKDSGLVSSGGQTSVTYSGLIDATYHWQARTMDSQGNSSAWISFGENSASATDFIVSTTPSQEANLKPIIEKLEPTSALPGKEITIRGKYFGEGWLERGAGNRKVIFGASKANIISWKNSEIVVQAPIDYGTGMLSAQRALFAIDLLEALATQKVSKLLLDAIPDKATLELVEGEAWWKSYGKIFVALAIPGVDVRPGGNEIVWTVEVETAAGKADSLPGANLFTYVVPLSIAWTSIPNDFIRARAPVGSSCDETFKVVGGRPPYNWSVSGALPAGLNLDPSTDQPTCRLSGSLPLIPGTYDFTIVVRDSGPPVQTASRTFSLQVDPPEIWRVIPDSAGQGDVAGLAIIGTGFTEPMTLSLGEGITINVLRVDNLNRITAFATIANNAALGPRNVSIRTSGAEASLAKGFQVNAPPSPSYIKAASPDVIRVSDLLDAYYQNKPSESTGGGIPTTQDIFQELDQFFGNNVK